MIRTRRNENKTAKYRKLLQKTAQQNESTVQ